MLGIKGNGTDSSPSKEGINDFTQHSIAAHRLAAIVRLGSESSGDLKFDIEDYLTTAFAKKFAKAEDGAEIGVTSAATDSISFDELIRLYLPGRFFSNTFRAALYSLPMKPSRSRKQRKVYVVVRVSGRRHYTLLPLGYIAQLGNKLGVGVDLVYVLGEAEPGETDLIVRRLDAQVLRKKGPFEERLPACYDLPQNGKLGIVQGVPWDRNG